MEAERHGISKEDLQDWFSRKLADHTVIKGFLKDEQYEKIEEFFKTADVQSLCKKLNEVLDEEQKQHLENEKIKIEHIAKYMLYYGVNTIYRFSKLRRTLPEHFFDDKKREPISKIIKGADTIDLETFEVSENVNLEPEVKEFIPQNSLSKDMFKRVALVDAFKNHNQIIDTIKKAEKRFIKIPHVLVNFDTHSDIYLDKPAENTIADWVNTVARDYDITDAYWVVPDVGLFNINTKEFFFGYNAENTKTFRGNYSYNNVYRDLSKPLTQRFLLEKINGTMVMDSVNYSKEEFASYLQTGKYKEIRVHICTKASLPKIKQDFILSIDADFFNNCGFDSDYHTEQLPFDKERAWEEFLEVWDKKMRRATIVGLCISPEYIGFSVLGATRGFYEYILNAVKKYSKKLY